MVTAEKRFDILAAMGPIAAAVVVGLIMFALYPNMDLGGSASTSYSDNSADLSGTTTAQYDNTTSGNDTSTKNTDTGSPNPPPTGSPGY